MGNALVGAAVLQPARPQRADRIRRAAGRTGARQGRVEGAVVDIGDKRQTIRARRGVILATGGFAPNEKLRAEFMRGPAGRAFQRFRGRERRWISRPRGPPARRWTTKHTSPAFYFPSSLHKDTVYPHILLDRAKPGLIAVNKDGRRFVNESDSYHDFVEGMFRANAATPSVPAWLICDRSFIRDYGIGLVHPGAGNRQIERYVADGYLTARRDADGVGAAHRRRRQEPRAQRAGAQSLCRDRHRRSLRQGRHRVQSVQRRSGQQAQSVPAADRRAALLRGRGLSIDDGHLRRAFDRRRCARA